MDMETQRHGVTLSSLWLSVPMWGDEGNGDMGIWGYGDMGIWGYGDMEIWRYGNMEKWRYGDMDM